MKFLIQSNNRFTTATIAVWALLALASICVSVSVTGGSAILLQKRQDDQETTWISSGHDDNFTDQEVQDATYLTNNRVDVIIDVVNNAVANGGDMMMINVDGRQVGIGATFTPEEGAPAQVDVIDLQVDTATEVDSLANTRSLSASGTIRLANNGAALGAILGYITIQLLFGKYIGRDVTSRENFGVSLTTAKSCDDISVTNTVDVNKGETVCTSLSQYIQEGYVGAVQIVNREGATYDIQFWQNEDCTGDNSLFQQEPPNNYLVCTQPGQGQYTAMSLHVQ